MVVMLCLYCCCWDYVCVKGVGRVWDVEIIVLVESVRSEKR